MDKNTIILEAQWMEQEIPRIEEEMNALKERERELLTTPMESISQAYTSTYQSIRSRAQPFYRRRRSVTPTRYGYRERTLDVGVFAILARLLILAAVVWAGYLAYTSYQKENLVGGVIWGLVVLVAAIGLAFAPAFIDEMWERHARKKAAQAAEAARESEAFFVEKQARQKQLAQCRTRMSELKERRRFSLERYDELRRLLTNSTDKGVTADVLTESDSNT